MRIAGWFLLVAGFVLCLSVAWATLGFLLMGVGLVALQVVERQQRNAGKAAIADIDHPPEPVATVPLAAATDAPVALESPSVPDMTLPGEAPAYDKEAWRRLVESDPELAQLNAVLADYGQHFVDAFASSYLATPDKGRIAGIVDEIIARANRPEASPNVEPSAPAAPAIIAPSREPSPPDPRSHRDHVKAPAPKPAAQDASTTDAPTVPFIRITPDQIRIEPERNDAVVTPANGDPGDMIRTFATESNSLRKS